MAIETGRASNVLVFRAMNGRSGPARRHHAVRRAWARQFRYPIGYDAYLMYVAMWARRFLLETGQDERRPRRRRARATRLRSRRTTGRTSADRSLADGVPGRAVRGGAVPGERLHGRGRRCVRGARHITRERPATSSTRRRSSRRRRTGRDPVRGLDIGDHLLWDDYTRNYTSLLREELFGRAGIAPRRRARSPRSTTASRAPCSWASKDSGICERGGVGRIRAVGRHRTRRAAADQHQRRSARGGLPARHEHRGEAVLQVQGRGGARQAPRHEVAVVTSGALMDGSALVLTSD